MVTHGHDLMACPKCERNAVVAEGVFERWVDMKYVPRGVPAKSAMRCDERSREIAKIAEGQRVAKKVGKIAYTYYKVESVYCRVSKVRACRCISPVSLYLYCVRWVYIPISI